MSRSERNAEPRPRQVLAAVGRTYGHAWADVDRLRAGRGRTFPAWPDWCFLPLQAAHALVNAGEAPLLPHQVTHIGIVGALAAWRVSQGIYRFDPDLAAAVAETPLEGELPTELLYRLPEWCVYVETPGRTFQGHALHGFWAHLDWELGEGADELRLLLDVARTSAEALDAQHGLIPIPVILGEGSLADALARVVESGRRRARGLGFIGIDSEPDPYMRYLEDITPLVALLLYLCAENAEFADGTRRPARPVPTRTKRGPRLFPPGRPTAWDVGVRLGASLRRAATEAVAAAPAADALRTHPHAHLRRAHWHTYRVGAGRSGRKLRWMAPIAVNVEDPNALPATVRPVE